MCGGVPDSYTIPSCIIHTCTIVSFDTNRVYLRIYFIFGPSYTAVFPCHVAKMSVILKIFSRPLHQHILYSSSLYTLNRWRIIYKVLGLSRATRCERKNIQAETLLQWIQKVFTRRFSHFFSGND